MGTARPGPGSKGPRLYDWLLLPLLQRNGAHWQHALLARRSLKEPTALAYYVVFAPREVTLAELVRVAARGGPSKNAWRAPKERSG